jgi:hypothetical protein
MERECVPASMKTRRDALLVRRQRLLVLTGGVDPGGYAVSEGRRDERVPWRSGYRSTWRGGGTAASMPCGSRNRKARSDACGCNWCGCGRPWSPIVPAVKAVLQYYGELDGQAAGGSTCWTGNITQWPAAGNGDPRLGGCECECDEPTPARAGHAGHKDQGR